MEVQVQNLGRKYWHSSFETLSMREFRRHVLGTRRIRGKTLEALDLPFITGGADLAVPDSLETYRDAWFLHDIDAHINTYGQVWYPNEEEPRWEGSVVASRTWGNKNKFALVADGGAITGVHEHALGMGTWITVCKGSVLWCWLNPSEVTEEQKVSVYDTIDRHGRPLRRDLQWRAVVLQRGDTFVMFPGTMHAVVRTKTERSLMFSGHFLLRSSLSTWIDVVILQLQHKGACNEGPGDRARQVLTIVWEMSGRS
ncbi:hypothetical protein KVT40_003352 [Elsinoe batatas]|uniref:JmjC domain-containing protein n=1 Tax=Elsinoe batatas TaxID=2601811 RepID=A0A8K0L5S0_9PEZI|nr:hypothetical protein KVT40_003352 [Elsinoe batatas]